MRRYILIVPDAPDKVNAEVSAEVRHNVGRELSSIFGGFSSYLGDGGWVNDQGRLITELHTRFEAFDDSTGQDAEIRRLAVRDVALRVKLALQQDCVLLACQAATFDLI